MTHAAIEARTERVRLATWVTPVPRRQPWQVAIDLATLDQLSDGRVMFGCGLGAPWNYQTSGIEYDLSTLARRYAESLTMITQLWTGEEVSYDGEEYTIEGMQLPITPAQEPRIPIVMGYWWPNTAPLKRAGRWDGMMPYAPSFFDGEGVQGEQPTGSIEDQTDDIFAY